MSVELIVLGLLTVLLIAQNIFWAKVCFNLTNRLMSRSYYEFEQAQALTRPKAQHPHSSNVTEMFDPEDERQAQGANSLLGLI